MQPLSVRFFKINYTKAACIVFNPEKKEKSLDYLNTF